MYFTDRVCAARHASRARCSCGIPDRALSPPSCSPDGKPNDLDQYEGRYGVEDTRQAVQAARRLGLQPFCVTIDEKANDYLPHLFGTGGYVVVRRPSELPKRLPLFYARLTV